MNIILKKINNMEYITMNRFGQINDPFTGSAQVLEQTQAKFSFTPPYM